MALTAHLSKTWKKRQLMISAFTIGLGLWFFYDGAIGFPKKNLRFDAHKRFQNENRLEEWPAYAASQGWAKRAPEKRYEKIDLAAQFVLGTISLVFGAGAFGWLIISSKRKLSSDSEAIYGLSGERVPFCAITSIDKRKWDSKGIAYAHYEIDGKAGRLTLDDYKFAGAEEMIRQAEQVLEEKLKAES